MGLVCLEIRVLQLEKPVVVGNGRRRELCSLPVFNSVWSNYKKLFAYTYKCTTITQLTTVTRPFSQKKDYNLLLDISFKKRKKKRNAVMNGWLDTVTLTQKSPPLYSSSLTTIGKWSGGGGYTHTGKSSRGPLGWVIIGYDRKKGRLCRKEEEKKKKRNERRRKTGRMTEGGYFETELSQVNSNSPLTHKIKVHIFQSLFSYFIPL